MEVKLPSGKVLTEKVCSISDFVLSNYHQSQIASASFSFLLFTPKSSSQNFLMLNSMRRAKREGNHIHISDSFTSDSPRVLYHT